MSSIIWAFLGAAAGLSVVFVPKIIKSSGASFSDFVFALALLALSVAILSLFMYMLESLDLAIEQAQEIVLTPISTLAP